METRSELRARIRKFLTYGDPEDVALVEQDAHRLLGGIIPGETHANFKDRSADRLAALMELIK